MEKLKMKWQTRIPRKTEKQIYYYATVFLAIVLGAVEIYGRFFQSLG